MRDLTATLRELLALTHQTQAALAVRWNEHRVAAAKEDLAASLDALDRCRAAQRIAGHQEAPSIPAALIRK